MQVRAITVNAASLAAEWNIQGNSPLGTDQAQARDSGFGPECRVSISREGKSLSRQQAAQAEKEKDVRSAQSIREEKKLLRQQEEAQRAKEIREGYREKLNEIEKQITDYNTSYAKFDMRSVVYDADLMQKTVEKQQELKEAMRSQKQFQAEEGQRRAREAQQMAMQAAQYQEEIDENNRDLLTLLKTMEEAEKAEDERENGEVKSDGSGAGVDASGTGNSVSDVIKGSAAQFMTSSINREQDVQERMAEIDESGRWFLNTAASITQNVLKKSAEIRATLDDESYTDEQIAEMMQNFQEGMAQNFDNVKNFRAFGLKVQRDMREARIQHIADDPLKGLQETKKSMNQSAIDAALGEARQSGLEKASQELADEVRELIDERNDVDGVRQDKEEEKEAQAKEAEEQEKKAEEQERKAEEQA